MTAPKTIPDFGTDAKAELQRQRYIIDNADYFTVMNGYHRITEYKTLVEARAGAKTSHILTTKTILVYAVYGPYSTWVENYDRDALKRDKIKED